MKRIFILMMIIMAITAPFVSAESVPMLDDSLFENAKEAVVCFASGDYETAAALMGISDVEELENFVTGNYATLSPDVQTYVSVAFWKHNAWFIAVPLYAPEDDSVEVLTLRSSDGLTVSGYKYCLWSDIVDEYSSCDYVTWNEEYLPESSVFIID